MTKTFKILSIDAWRDGSSWSWNNWFTAGEFPAELIGMNPRQLFKWFRDEGYLKESSKGKVAIEDDQYNLVILDRGTREPLFAIEYGASL
jgi:hypothetical protein